MVASSTQVSMVTHLTSLSDANSPSCIARQSRPAKRGSAILFVGGRLSRSCTLAGGTPVKEGWR